MNENPIYEVKEATSADIKDVIEFNEKMFPLRSHTAEFFDYRFRNLKSPLQLSNIIIAKLNDEIVGHRVAQKQEMAYNEKVHEAYWGTDLIVETNHRGMGIAKNIVFKMMENHPNLFLLNIGDQNLKMHLKLGYTSLNDLKLYFKPLKFIVFTRFLLNLLIRRKKIVQNNHSTTFEYKFPAKCNEFKLIENVSEIKNQKLNWNKDYIEGIRTVEYLDWRFFHKKDKYFFYQSEKNEINQNKSYFVLRTINWKGMNCLMMADARYGIGSEEDRLVKKAVLKIAKLNKFDGILWGSSIIETQNLLKKSGFLKYSDLAIISNLSLKTTPVNLISHFADSDLEFNYSNSTFVYA